MNRSAKCPRRGSKKKETQNDRLTSEVPVILRAALTLTVLGLGGPVGHAAELVALGEGSIGHTVEHVVGGGGRTPGVLHRQSGDQVRDRSRSHCDDVNSTTKMA